ncbi:MAG: T9SS type A sorting domain-containing protein [Bacteroidia bacterium]
MGGHTNGPNPNRFGITNFLNAFIAEVGDSLLLGVPELSNSNQGFGVEVLPNPNSGEFSIGVSNDLGFLRKVDLLDLGGRTVAVSTSLDRKTVHFGLSHLPSGIYFARLHVNARAVRYAKVIVNHGG